jgi:serine/threonine protein kinase
MELAEGPTLAESIAAGPIPPAEAPHIARQIAAALEYAHEKGINYRDLNLSDKQFDQCGATRHER